MIPMFKAKEEEALHEYNRISLIKDELNTFKQDMGMPAQPRQVQPLVTTSFMVRKSVTQ